MEDKKFDILKQNFADGFTDRVMNRIDELDEVKSYKSERVFLNWMTAAAAACILIFGAAIAINGDSFDVESQTGLSQYSDFELNELGYFDQENDSDE